MVQVVRSLAPPVVLAEDGAELAMNPVPDRGAMSGELTQLLQALEGGDRAALDRAFALVYDELKRQARRQRVRADGSALSTTALVHETYLKFVRAEAISASSREHFHRLAARAMRQVLLDEARIAGAVKRPRLEARNTLDDAAATGALAPDDLIDLDRALASLEQVDPRLAEVAQLHLFAGLEFAEIASLRQQSERTVLRDWRKARALLATWLEGYAA
jgi:RNA polymerase sigma factor (TIGR02999 family)